VDGIAIVNDEVRRLLRKPAPNWLNSSMHRSSLGLFSPAQTNLASAILHHINLQDQLDLAVHRPFGFFR